MYPKNKWNPDYNKIIFNFAKISSNNDQQDLAEIFQSPSVVYFGSSAFNMNYQDIDDLKKTEPFPENSFFGDVDTNKDIATQLALRKIPYLYAPVEVSYSKPPRPYVEKVMLFAPPAWRGNLAATTEDTADMLFPSISNKSSIIPELEKCKGDSHSYFRVDLTSLRFGLEKTFNKLDDTTNYSRGSEAFNFVLGTMKFINGIKNLYPDAFANEEEKSVKKVIEQIVKTMKKFGITNNDLEATEEPPKQLEVAGGKRRRTRHRKVRRSKKGVARKARKKTRRRRRRGKKSKKH